MRMSGGLTEDGIVVGNSFDKYGSSNPIVRWMMAGFETALSGFVERAQPSSIHEVGCGEGYWVARVAHDGEIVKGSDFSSKVIEIARSNAAGKGLSPDIFEACSIYDLEPARDSAELVVCCEVLEHLEHREVALKALQKIAAPYLIVSVPREPIWSALNMARRKYWSSLGNTPGHIQRWSQNSFVDLVGRYFEITEVRAPLPWTMLLAVNRDPIVNQC